MSGSIRCVLFSAGLFASTLLSACNNGGSDSSSSSGGKSYDKTDFGDNDRNKVVALGDSITAGGECRDEGQSYPSRIAGITGLKVINAGVSGESSGGAADRAGGVLSKNKPGFMLILTGHNDAIFDRDYNEVMGNIRSIVRKAKDNKTVPILATLVPINAPRVWATGPAEDYSAGIRKMANEEGVQLVDLEKEFGLDESLQCDGLHPNSSGSAIIANAFADKLP